MKKHFFLPLAAVAMLFAGCSSNDEPLVESKKADAGEVTYSQSYLSVTIAPTMADGASFAPSRADNSETEDSDPKNYEAGEEDENRVTSVRFYFFTSDGDIARVKRTADGDMVNYYDVDVPTVNENNPEGMPQVEKGLNTVLVINTAEGDERPAKILAVCNRSDRLGNSSKKLTDVRNTIYDYATFAQNENQFVMCSSVYASADKQEIAATTIPETSFQDQEAAARLNPVVIYVERVVAKVSVKLDEKALGTSTVGGYTLVPLKDDKGNDITVDGNKVYAKFLGWNLTAATVQSSLSKHINPAWNVFPAWNYAPFFRSYWAQNCEGAGSRYMPFAKTDGNNYFIAENKKLNSEYTSLYANENAAAYANYTNGEGRAYPSSVIMAAQLCKADGSSIAVCKWIGETHIGVENLMTRMLNQLETTKTVIYSKEGTTVSQIKADDLKFVTAVQAGKATLNETTTGRYFTYLVLSEAGEGKAWYSSKDCNDASRMTNAEVNNFLKATIGGAEVWNAGYTYYYFPVQHIGVLSADGTNMGAYGVVRNHIYRSNITSIVGLGTPVYDPKETIYPEKPESSNTYVAARINIIPWRVVANNVELDWSGKK